MEGPIPSAVQSRAHIGIRGYGFLSISEQIALFMKWNKGRREWWHQGKEIKRRASWRFFTPTDREREKEWYACVDVPATACAACHCVIFVCADWVGVYKQEQDVSKRQGERLDGFVPSMVGIQAESREEIELEDEDDTADVVEGEGAALGTKATSCIALKPHKPISESSIQDVFPPRQGCCPPRFQCVRQNECIATASCPFTL